VSSNAAQTHDRPHEISDRLPSAFCTHSCSASQGRHPCTCSSSFRAESSRRLPFHPPLRRRLLREAFTSGRLEEAPSKAELLGELCDQVGFDADAAAALHSSLFRQKLATLLEKKKLTGAHQERGDQPAGGACLLCCRRKGPCCRTSALRLW
jgi:hypothetical protein